MRNHQSNDVFCIMLIFVLVMSFLTANAKAEDKFSPQYVVQETDLTFKINKEEWGQNEKAGNPFHRGDTRRVQILKGKETKFGIEGGLGADNDAQLLLHFRKEF